MLTLLVFSLACLVPSRKVNANHTPNHGFMHVQRPFVTGRRRRKRLHFRRVVINPWKRFRDAKACEDQSMLRVQLMRKVLALAAGLALLSTWGQAQQHEQDRLKHSGEVLMEILNIPDNLPKYWLDRAECVIVLPSVKKGAFGVGG